VDGSRVATGCAALVFGTLTVLSAWCVLDAVRQAYKQAPTIYNLGGFFVCTGMGIVGLTCVLTGAWVVLVRSARRNPLSYWQEKAITLGIWMGIVITGIGFVLTFLYWFRA